jgi:Xaa-Pro aminopeptidase
MLGLIESQTAQAARIFGDLPESERRLLRALELLPTLVPAQLDLSDLRMSKSPPDIDGARAALRGALQSEPANSEALRRLKLLDLRFGPAPAH